ncbi:MAG: tetratricopeptide repeat protein [Myxococcota bacterium]
MRERRVPLRSILLVAAALGLAPGAGCARMVTLSAPDSEAFRDAMAEATRHEHHGRREEAARAYARAAEAADRRVDRDEADYRRAHVLEELGHTDRALTLLDDIASRRPPSRRTARARFDAALMRYDTGAKDAALKGFRTVAVEHSDSGLGGRALWYLVKDRRDADDDAGALRLVRSLYPRLRDTSLGDDLLHYEARILKDRGDRAGARAALERLVDNHPYPQGHRWDDALLELSEWAEEAGEPRRAIGYLEALVQRHDTTTMVGSYTLPSMPKAQLRIAQLYRDEVGDDEAAAAAYERLVAKFPRSTLRDDALFELGELHFDRGDRAAACELFERVEREFEVGHARRQAAERLREDCGKR